MRPYPAGCAGPLSAGHRRGTRPAAGRDGTGLRRVRRASNGPGRSGGQAVRGTLAQADGGCACRERVISTVVPGASAAGSSGSRGRRAVSRVPAAVRTVALVVHRSVVVVSVGDGLVSSSSGSRTRTACPSLRRPRWCRRPARRGSPPPAPVRAAARRARRRRPASRAPARERPGGRARAGRSTGPDRAGPAAGKVPAGGRPRGTAPAPWRAARVTGREPPCERGGPPGKVSRRPRVPVGAHPDLL